MDDVQRENNALLVFESAMARMEREHSEERKQHRRLVCFLCSIILVMALGLIGMFIYESQWVDEEWTFDAYTDGEGSAIANGNGEVNYYGIKGESNAP